MKTNFYIFLILLLSFSVANAQEKTTAVKVSAVNELHVTNIVLKTSQDLIAPATIENSESNNEAVAKAASDIRIYLNRERNLENIDLLFPKIHKEEMA